MMLDDRFWSKVSKDDSVDGCWVWTANKNNKGYGLFRPGGTEPKRLSHRLSYENEFGPIPAGMNILHSCDNPACVNPSHLRTGTQAENYDDMVSRGRRVVSTKKGEEIGTSILTIDQVIDIRESYVSGEPLKSICTRFGISERSLSDYTSGRSWRHILGLNGSPTLAQLKAECRNRRRNNSRLNKSIADEIREKLSSGCLGVDLAIEYGVHKATISDIKKNKIWAD